MKYATLTIPVEITIYSQHETGIRDRDGADDADLRCGQLNGTGVAIAKRFDYGTRSVDVDQQECIQGTACSRQWPQSAIQDRERKSIRGLPSINIRR
jgi:hypothetical protein